jgi:hypothetical protein
MGVGVAYVFTLLYDLNTLISVLFLEGLNGCWSMAWVK